ncbi:AraC family transcriptional regulator [Janthinobacterium sp. B9-8]|uniref:AraC family transcriptional regulator n=1 Tax=Janthinobacterium sp. B9-8 TaxID=1236179 RepID=UPI00069A9E97|nr:AraC family transcriptional regulator [Janthinobacterium sp. B9-8]AMC33389.1 hypothetical protein VN23_01585 [Janthinobacterium sp. B9-8]
MSKSWKVEDYGRRLMRVVNTIWQDPTAAYSIEQLAGIAHFSPFHFHRIYREMMGETVNATQLRMRLLYASRQLAQTNETPLIRIAQRAGYQSSAAFVRSFAAAHGMPPGAYRRQRLNHIHSQINQELGMYNVEFRKLDAPIHLAASRHHGSYLKIGEAFARLQLSKTALPVDPMKVRWFAQYHDDPQSVAEADLRSDACVEIKADGDLPSELARAQIPAGRYGVIEHRGPYSELQQAYHWLFGVWLPQSGEQPANIPVIEQYLNLPHNTPPKDLRTEIWVALAT